MRAAPGRTILNVLVVVSILGVLAAMIPPAMVRIRESARQARCRSNLEQCGLALHAYHDANRMFPPGIVAIHVPERGRDMDCDFVATQAVCEWPGASLASGLSMMLPYLGEQSILNAYNVDLACCSAANATAGARRVAGYVCPSNPRFEGLDRLPYYHASEGVAGSPAPTDYVFSMGGYGAFHCYRRVFKISGGAVRHMPPGSMKIGSGLFFVNSDTTFDDIKDGTSHTFVMGESCGGGRYRVGLSSSGRVVDAAQPMTAASDAASCEARWSQGYIGGPPKADGSNNGGYGSVFAATAWNAWYDTQRQLAPSSKWFALPPNEGGNRFGRPTWYLQSIAPFDILAPDGTALPGSIGSIQGFRGPHPGKILILYADGSVRESSDAIDSMIWVALSTPTGREQLPDDL